MYEFWKFLLTPLMTPSTRIPNEDKGIGTNKLRLQSTLVNLVIFKMLLENNKANIGLPIDIPIGIRNPNW